MNFDKYTPTLSWAPYGTLEGKAYHSEAQRLEQQFFDDTARIFGYENHPKRSKLESIAWEEGHSSGLESVYHWAEELSELLKD
jgi:hypothetical protein